MNCPVCNADAEQIAATINGIGIICPTCGHYDISNSVLAAKAWQRLGPDERCDVLGKAELSAQPGVRPIVTSNLLAADIEPSEQSAAIEQ